MKIILTLLMGEQIGVQSIFGITGSVGNYWSDYQTRYPNTSEIGNTGIGDTPYVIDANNVDGYPLIAPFKVTPAPTPSPEPQPETEPFPTAIVATASGVSVIVIGIGLLPTSRAPALKVSFLCKG
jgi:hypothetical protein